MGHAVIENLTPFVFDSSFAIDEEGRPLFVPIIKATYSLRGPETEIAESQVPVNPGGEFWGEPGESSYKYEPECAFTKIATDVVLIGSACSTSTPDPCVDVRMRVGSLDKTVRVIGDRYWVKSFGMLLMTPAEPFVKMPLIYERAFGGWDRSHSDEERHSFERRNPLGTGFRSKAGRFEDRIRLPNLEDPQQLITGYHDTPAPAGFGFTSPDWQPRARYAGVYDAAWLQDRMPLLPADFDRRYFSAASAGLIAPGYLMGNEPVHIENVLPSGPVSFDLPGVSAPRCRIQLAGSPDVTVTTNLDTVIINSDEGMMLLLWRGQLPLNDSLHDVVAVQITCERLGSPVIAG
jgi:hypothetical protein